MSLSFMIIFLFSLSSFSLSTFTSFLFLLSFSLPLGKERREASSFPLKGGRKLPPSLFLLFPPLSLSTLTQGK
jgi:hypothetical protein